MEKKLRKISDIKTEQTLNNTNQELVSDTPNDIDIKKQNFSLQIAQVIYNGIKDILIKDEFGIFELKSKKIIDLKIAKINKEIEKLISLNTKIKTQQEKINTSLTTIRSENTKLIAALQEKLR